MEYLWLKLIHILSATILFGTGIGTASTFLFAHRTGNPHIIASTARYVVLADWMFTTSSGIIQPITGLWMMYLAGYALTSTWILGAIVGYLIAACCWFPVVYLQIKMRDIASNAAAKKSALPAQYYQYFKVWFWLGWPAFFTLMIVFYLMTFKPIG